MSLRYLYLSVAGITLAACGQNAPETPVDTAPETVAEVAAEQVVAAEEPVVMTLDAVLAMQDDAAKARYQYRNPKATLEYFGIEPGMTVAEVLPGGGWYSKILLPYLGDGGKLIGIDYSVDMWSNFGGFANQDFLEKRKTWSETWSNDALAWRAGTEADVAAFALGSMPADMAGTADAVLLFRSLHHLNRFEAAYWDEALADIKAVLKPGGVVGIVQHAGPEENPDTWANGDNGYLKLSFILEKFDEAGFELAKDPSEINANEKDVPTAEDMVWRLPPTLGTSRDNPELKAKMEAIGESNRVTLLFRKKD